MPLSCLIVDDSTPFLRVARDLLEREGLTVVGVASTGAEALRQAETLQPDVALVDIMLGEESGFELARKLAASDVEGRPTIVLISTRDESDLAELIAESPAAGFVLKSNLSAHAIRRIAQPPEA